MLPIVFSYQFKPLTSTLRCTYDVNTHWRVNSGSTCREIVHKCRQLSVKETQALLCSIKLCRCWWTEDRPEMTITGLEDFVWMYSKLASSYILDVLNGLTTWLIAQWEITSDISKKRDIVWLQFEVIAESHSWWTWWSANETSNTTSNILHSCCPSQTLMVTVFCGLQDACCPCIAWLLWWSAISAKAIPWANTFLYHEASEMRDYLVEVSQLPLVFNLRQERITADTGLPKLVVLTHFGVCYRSHCRFVVWSNTSNCNTEILAMLIFPLFVEGASP